MFLAKSLSPMAYVERRMTPRRGDGGAEPARIHRERDFGVFEGLTEAEAAQRYPALAARNAAYRWDEEPTDAEPTRALVARVERGLQLLREEHDGQTVLLVSHGFVVRCLRYLIDGLSDHEFFAAERIPNGYFLTRQLP